MTLEEAAGSLKLSLDAYRRDASSIVLGNDSLHVYIRPLYWFGPRPRVWEGYKVHWNLGVGETVAF